VNHDRIEVALPLPKPGNKSGQISITATTWTKGMDAARKFVHSTRVRCIETDDFNLMPSLSQDKSRLLHRLEWAADGRIKRMNAT
jgi:hypothetical protein